jgi:hypothetical protein
MSLDLYVHCKSSRRLETKQVIDALAARQIGAALFKDYINYEPAPAGAVTFCTILGWMPKSFDHTRLNELLRRSDKKKQLDRLFATEVLAYANVDAHAAADHYETFGDDYPDSLAGEIDRHFIDFMKSAKTVYEIQTSAGRSDLSWRFQMALCCVIAESVDGLIEEPQMGEFFFPKDAERHFRGFAQ